ncbi:AAA family ATPase [Aquibacillus saliphilus]|uniref:AAA family ATPase n=1 Tax=Aquibacillus saliphilus TaxID=1909422 RepID=UPI001CEFEBF9|nr:AAA family ATPase [Aquibacillus saliphilus]
MKPLKLKLTAFGPYKNTETIDFTELHNNRLFVVSGNTGAGKTTIFDGICFALYGSASGEDRNDSRLLRSDFADDNVHTAIELEFELHGRIFRVLRQLGHVKQGNKGATGERYEFYEKNGDKEIPCVDRQIVTEINQKIEALIGLSQDQFSQIVMLPQGEFRKLLTSQTENKEEILRRIFKTEPYKQISEKLKLKKKTAEETYNQKSQQRENFIGNISATLPSREQSELFNVISQENYNVNQVTDGLAKEVAFYEGKTQEDDKKYNNAYQLHDQKQTDFHKAKSLNEQFNDLDTKEVKLKSALDQVPLFNSKERQLHLAERASTVQIYEKQLKEWQETIKLKNEVLNNATISMNKSIEELEHAQKFYQQEENQKQEREHTSKKLDRLNDILPLVKDNDLKKQQLLKLETNVNQLEEQLKSLENQIKLEKDSKVKRNQIIKSLESSVNQLPTSQQRLTDMREKYKQVDEYIKLRDTHSEIEKELTTKKGTFNSARDKYTKIEAAWINGQASILATHLHNGQPCPVCGSKEHPNKVSKHEGTPTKEDLELAKTKMNEVESDYRTVLARHETSLSTMKSKQNDMNEYSYPLNEIDLIRTKLMEEGLQLKVEVDQLKSAQEKLTAERDSFEKIEKKLDELDLIKEQATKSYNEQKNNYDSQKAVYQERLESIPEDVRDLTTLERQIKETEAFKAKLEKAWDQAQKRLQQTKESHTKAQTDLTHAKSQLQETSDKTDASEKTFNQALQKAGFTSALDYTEAIMTLDTQSTLKTEIEEFNKTLSLLKEQVKVLKDALKDKKRVDLSELSEELNQLRKAYESALNELNQSKEYRKEALELKLNIIEANENVRQEEQQLNRITDLFDVIRGQNSSKISFERYLQIEYLEQIIQAANERLKRISNGQFYLMRSDRMESRGRQSGLGLDVYDAYTGQTRDVKTLSGGEKFNASLCLALGMADVIQSFQGGVSIETMFIDEGFGSLDEESLNKAIDTLIDLQKSGRMIGVISHVHELKTAIPAILQVEKTKEGFSRTKFIVS